MDGWESCLRFTLYALNTEPSPRVRCHLVHELTTLATTLCASAGPLKALPAPLSDELCQLVVGPRAQEDSRLRHAVFALLQCLGQRPPTLHRALADRPLPPEGVCECVCASGLCYLPGFLAGMLNSAIGLARGRKVRLATQAEECARSQLCW